jgi:prepilin-type N-terminal cleavage/methylation domain-containing protein
VTCFKAQHHLGSRRTRRAFSLVELVLVLTIIAIVAAIAAPRYAGAAARYRADFAARRIAADLAAALSNARTTSKSQTVVFNVAAGTYQISGLRELDSASTAYLINLSADPYKVTIGTANFNGASQVTFSAYGQADNSGSVTVQAGGITRTITLDNISGRTVVQ